MKISSALKILIASGAILTTLPAYAGDNIESIFKDGKVFGEARYRYEYVDQDGFADEARASTLRTNLGFKTGEYKSFQALLEAQLVTTLGADDFNDTVNGKTAFPTVADPDGAELNQAWVTWTGVQDSLVKVGRQGINLDNQRFLGTVGWRQNDQTFDSVLLANSSIPNLDLAYAYVWNVNRINGSDHNLGDLSTETHAAHASYKVADWMTAVGYGYWLDIDRAPSLSSQTYGLRFTGDVALNDAWTFFYTAEAATQDDHADNTSSYDENYYHLAPGIKGMGWTFMAGYEELGGDGTNAFQTPLATGHKFNGWADKFLSTPATGLEDAYATISYKASDLHPFVDGTKVTATYHKFDGDTTGDYGSELDLSVGKSFALTDHGQPFKSLDVAVKYADYNADDAPFTDTQKVWFQVGVKF